MTFTAETWPDPAAAAKLKSTLARLERKAEEAADNHAHWEAMRRAEARRYRQECKQNREMLDRAIKERAETVARQPAVNAALAAIVRHLLARGKWADTVDALGLDDMPCTGALDARAWLIQWADQRRIDAGLIGHPWTSGDPASISDLMRVLDDTVRRVLPRVMEDRRRAALDARNAARKAKRKSR